MPALWKECFVYYLICILMYIILIILCVLSNDVAYLEENGQMKLANFQVGTIEYYYTIVCDAWGPDYFCLKPRSGLPQSTIYIYTLMQWLHVLYHYL